jgi:leucyl-tRNA synthetase
MSEAELAEWDASTAVWRSVQSTIEQATASYQKIYPINTVVSNLMILTNTLLESEKASPLVQREAVSATVRMMAPITPAFAEECWSLLHPGAGSVFGSSTFPVADDTAALLQPRKQPVAIQINGKLRGVVDIPKPPGSLKDEALREWMVAEVLKTEEGKSRFSEGPWDVRSPRRVILARGGKTINFVV